MAKLAVWRIELSTEDQRVLFSGVLTHIMPREDLILRKSEEFFSDPAPCFIHRSAVMKRLFMELEAHFSQAGATEQSHLLAELPEDIADILRIDPLAYRVTCRYM